MRVLVTGATGFIGGHLVRHLLDQGHRVRALVRRKSPALTEAGAELSQGDVTDAEAVRAAVQGVEAVFHLAAAHDMWGRPESVYQRVNVEGTRHLLKAAAGNGSTWNGGWRPTRRCLFVSPRARPLIIVLRLRRSRWRSNGPVQVVCQRWWCDR